MYEQYDFISFIFCNNKCSTVQPINTHSILKNHKNIFKYVNTLSPTIANTK